MATVAYSYDDKAIREDLLNEIQNLSPREAQLSTGLGTTQAKGVMHEYLIKALGAVKVNAYTEGAEASYDVQNSSRLFNYTQIFLVTRIS